MSWTPVMRGLLALALVQVLLGGVLAIAGPDDDGASVGEIDGTTTTAVPGSPAAPGEAPGAPVDTAPPPSPGAPPPASAPTDSTIPPTGAGRPQAPQALPIHSTYEQLTPEEQAHVDRGGGQAIVEGRVSDGHYWRLSASISGDKVCPEQSYWDQDAGRGGSGGGGCTPNSEWSHGAGGPGGDYGFVGMRGFAPVEAQEFELVAKDGRRGRVGGVFRPEMGVSFYVAWLDCRGPDLERMNALAADGRVVSSYRFADHMGEIDWPSYACDPGGGG